MYGGDNNPGDGPGDPAGDFGPPNIPDTPWWQGPPPAGFKGQWPPPLPPGASYGPNLGQIVYAPTTPGGTEDPFAFDPTHDATQIPNNPYTPPPPPPPSPTGGGTGGSGGGAAGTIGGLLAPFQPPTPRYGYPDLPVFTAPVFTPPPAFADPTMGEVQSDPGYEFARSEGLRAVEAGKAAGGVYNTGGTLKDLVGWGNNFATQRYGDVRNRKQDTYLTNYKTQFMDPYEKLYRGALDEFAPKMTNFSTQAAWNQRANEDDWTHAWDVFRDQRDSTYNKTYQYAST